MLSLSEATRLYCESDESKWRADGGAPVAIANGWFFPDFYIGSSGVIVDGEDGHLFALGSGFPASDSIWAYEHGLRWHLCDLVVTSIHDHARAVALLQGCLLRHGADHHPRRGYSASDLSQRLTSLPARFASQNIWLSLPELRATEGVLDLQGEPDSHATVASGAVCLALTKEALIELARQRYLGVRLIELIDSDRLDVVATENAVHEASEVVTREYERVREIKAETRARRRAGLPPLPHSPAFVSPAQFAQVPYRLVGEVPPGTPCFNELDNLRLWLRERGMDVSATA